MNNSILMVMETINKYRIDAHAKKINDDAFFQLRYALEWIEDKIK